MINFGKDLPLDYLKDLKKLISKYQSEFINFYSKEKEFKKYFNHYFTFLNNQNESFKNFFNSKSCSLQDYKFKIGSVVVKTPVVCAPLAGISDNTYRIFAKAFGSSLSFTEMISSYGAYYNSKDSILLSNITEYERPCGIQIFGSEPDIMLEAAKRFESNADLIDINMGCPVPKVLKTKSGGYLLNDEQRVAQIISKVSSNIQKPVTIKTRIGWDSNNINIKKIARIAEDSGASAITIHGRTVKQGFSGDVNYEIIKEVKKNVKIPVIVSGDIDLPLKAKKVLDFTGCDAVMIGRVARGSLWNIFNILAAFCCNNDLFNCRSFFEDFNLNLNYGNYFNYNPSIAWKKEFAVLYLKFMVYFKGEEKAVKEYRKYFSWIFKGIAGIGRLRRDFFKVKTFDAAVELIRSII